MTQPDCSPQMNVVPPPCGPGSGDWSPGGPVEVAGCCSPSIATVQLCTTDCAPVTVVVRSGCTECAADADAPQVVGWLDPAGGFTSGPPPAGLGPCDSCGQQPPEPCEPVPRCPGLVGLSDGEVWSPPAGVESITVNVVCAPVTVRPCAGDDEVVINECGSMSWSAPGDPCTPAELCAGFEVEIPEGSAAYIAYMTTDCGGA